MWGKENGNDAIILYNFRGYIFKNLSIIFFDLIILIINFYFRYIESI